MVRQLFCLPWNGVNKVFKDRDLWDFIAMLLLMPRHIDWRIVTEASEELAVSIFRASTVQDILRFSAFETSITIYQAPYHIAKLECFASRLCHEVVSLRLLIRTFKKKCDFLCCNRRLHKALFSVALEIISRMCPLAWPLYVAKHQILEADIISSSRRWTFVPVSDHKSREPWSSLTSPY